MPPLFTVKYPYPSPNHAAAAAKSRKHSDPASFCRGAADLHFAATHHNRPTVKSFDARTFSFHDWIQKWLASQIYHHGFRRSNPGLQGRRICNCGLTRFNGDQSVKTSRLSRRLVFCVDEVPPQKL